MVIIITCKSKIECIQNKNEWQNNQIINSPPQFNDYKGCIYLFNTMLIWRKIPVLLQSLFLLDTQKIIKIDFAKNSVPHYMNCNKTASELNNTTQWSWKTVWPTLTKERRIPGQDLMDKWIVILMLSYYIYSKPLGGVYSSK